MKKAVLDIGSNSIKFLLAEVQPNRALRIIKEDSATTRLAEGMEKTGELGGPAMEKTVTSVRHYLEQARAEGAERILCLATSAVRDAKNRADFEKSFKDALGTDLLVLSGKQEAALVFSGAVSDESFPQDNVVVMDVGGGSAEWILGNHGQILKQHSAPLGCVRMTEKFLEGDPCTEASFQALSRHLESEIGKLRGIFPINGRVMIATGGTACSLAAMDCDIDKRPGGVHGKILDTDRVHVLVDFLRSLPQRERERLPGIPPSRADVVTAGAACFMAALTVLEAEALMVSVRGLRYGALFV